MTSLFLSNQGENKNSYASMVSVMKKNENSYSSQKKLADMSTFSGHKNMPSLEGSYYAQDFEDVSEDLSCDDYIQEVYSDADVYSDEDDEDVYGLEMTEAQQIEDELADDELNKKRLEDPNEMEYILPPRVLPSVKEQHDFFYSMIDAERNALYRKWAVEVIEKAWVKLLALKKEQAGQKILERRAQELSSWKLIMHGRRGILRLGPVDLFETQYSRMTEMRKRHNLIKADLDERNRMIKVRAEHAIAKEKASIRMRKAFKARALANLGMNKNTAWHNARRANSLAFATKTITSSEKGAGRRAQRKIRQEKDRKEAVEYATRLGPVKKNDDIMSFTDLEDNEKTEEELEAEKAELDEALALINRKCVESEEKRVAEEKEEIEEKKRIDEEKKEEDEFVKVMIRNKKSKLTKIELGFKGLREQVVERRRDTDKKYNVRCEAFEVLASKEKLQEKLKFTTLCRSVTSGKKCYHKACNFAHSIDDLQDKECRFGLECRFVKQLSNGQYENAKFGRTGKSCSCMHPGETKKGFCKRMGLNFTESTPVTPTPVTPVTTQVIPATVTPNTTPVVNVWTKVVTKAEATEKFAECKAKMTKQWNSVVFSTLTEEEKTAMYGRGVTMLGFVSDDHNSTPIVPTTTRKSWDKRGLGFDTRTQKSFSNIYVKAPGFSWVKGAVLKPPRHPEDSPIEENKATSEKIMQKVMEAVRAINTRIAKLDTIDISKVKKSEEIEKRLERQERRRNERAKRQVEWKKVGRRKKERMKETEVLNDNIVIRVPRSEGELALLSALRNGLQNFRIEYIN